VKVVADTNILVSAIIFGGNPQAVLDLAQEGQIELFVSDAILMETTRILRDKFHRSAEELRSDVLALRGIKIVRVVDFIGPFVAPDR
jgi:putative PIN family toxin of toxin-antitoxin system